MINKEQKIYSNVPKELLGIARVAKLMDSSIKVPWLNRTIGIEPIIGLVPVVGDAIGFGVGVLIMIALLRNNGSSKVAAKMTLNIIVDILISFIPLIGNMLDFFVKSNQKNLKLAIDHFEYGDNQGSAWSVILPLVIGLTALFLLAVVATVVILYYIITWFFSVL